MRKILEGLILIFGIMYFLLIRPQQKKLKDHKAMVEAVRHRRPGPARGRRLLPAASDRARSAAQQPVGVLPAGAFRASDGAMRRDLHGRVCDEGR